MKMSATFSIEQAILVKFYDKIARKSLSKNEIINRLLSEWIADDDKVGLITCALCKTRYSSKLTTCPACQLKESEQEVKSVDLLLSDQEKDRKMRDTRSNIQKELAEIQDYLRNAHSALNRIKEDPERQEQSKKIQSEIDQKRARLDQLKQQLMVI